MKYLKFLLIIGFINFSSSVFGQNVFPASGNVGIGTTSPTSILTVGDYTPIIKTKGTLADKGSILEYEMLRLVGTASDYIISIQDGTGRVQHYWNASAGTTNTYLVADEKAGKILFSPPSPEIFTINYAPGGNAGESIVWQKHFGITQEGDVNIDNGDLLLNSGNFGIGGANWEQGRLYVKEFSTGGSTMALDAYTDKNANIMFLRNGLRAANIRVDDHDKDQLQFMVGNSLIEAMTIDTLGRVGIGIKDPSEKLVVDGKILAEEIRIENVPSSDYVFEPEYKLKSIEEVEMFIKDNKHLPDVPSAQEFKENGVGLGEMDDMLLRKIEELTLYIIELKKENKELKELILNK